MLGDGVWEGPRVHNGKTSFLVDHMDRLYEAAKAIDLDIIMSKLELIAELHETPVANGMAESVHIRLMITQGNKKSPF